LFLAQRIRLPLVQAALDQLMVKTVLHLVRLRLVAVQAETANLLLVKMVLLVALAVVVVTLTSLEEVGLLLGKVIAAAIARLQLAAGVVLVLLAAHQMAALE
jgi:hypothetical protein